MRKDPKNPSILSLAIPTYQKELTMNRLFMFALCFALFGCKPELTVEIGRELAQVQILFVS